VPLKTGTQWREADATTAATQAAEMARTAQNAAAQAAADEQTRFAQAARESADRAASQYAQAQADQARLAAIAANERYQQEADTRGREFAAREAAAIQTSSYSNTPSDPTGIQHSYMGDKFSLVGATVTTEYDKEVLPGLTARQANSNYGNNGPDATDYLTLHDRGYAQQLNQTYLSENPTHLPPHAENRMVASYEPKQPAHFILQYSSFLGNMPGQFVADAHNSGTDYNLFYGADNIADVTVSADTRITRSYIARSADNALQYVIDPLKAIFRPRP
jgi:hypothetical protein